MPMAFSVAAVTVVKRTQPLQGFSGSPSRHAWPSGRPRWDAGGAEAQGRTEGAGTVRKGWQVQMRSTSCPAGALKGKLQEPETKFVHKQLKGE